ncbi:MAG: tetratricopeptide repeat protein [Anaerolineales bacterium]|nr:tetratricopeptide repeat protein [Anaerolineales bacterium]
MSNHETWNELGNLYLMNGAYEPAIHAYLRSIQSNNKFGRSYSNLALAFVYTGKYSDAIKLYRRSIELLSDAKEKAITWNRLGILYRHIRDYKNAMEAYQRADVLDPQLDEPRNGVELDIKFPLTVSMPSIDLNRLLDENHPTQKVEMSTLSSEAPAPLHPAKSQTAAQWLDDDLVPLDIEKIRQEMESKQAAIKTPVNEQGSWVSNDLSDASVPENLAVKEDESFQSEETLTDSQSQKFINSAPEDMIEHEIGPSNQGGPLLPELSPEELKNIELDIAKYRAETINNPRNVTAWERLGDAYKSAGMYKDAIQAIKNAIVNNSTKPSYYYRLGLIYAAERREAEAVLAFQKVLELNPKHTLAHASLGSHYRKMGMDEQAQIHIKQALSTNLANENEYNRACLEAICGNTDRAIELLQIAIQTKQTYINWVRNDPDLDSLHDDERFKSLITAYATSI